MIPRSNKLALYSGSGKGRRIRSKLTLEDDPTAWSRDRAGVGGYSYIGPAIKAPYYYSMVGQITLGAGIDIFNEVEETGVFDISARRHELMAVGSEQKCGSSIVWGDNVTSKIIDDSRVSLPRILILRIVSRVGSAQTDQSRRCDGDRGAGCLHK